MKWIGKSVTVLVCMLFLLTLAVYSPSTAMAAKVEKKAKMEKALSGTVAEKVPKPKAEFDASKMADMSDYDPANPVIPTGDTIKIALVASFSGPAAIVGQLLLDLCSMGGSRHQ